nr:ORF3a [Mute swan feces associated gammacoronavirus]
MSDDSSCCIHNPCLSEWCVYCNPPDEDVLSDVSSFIINSQQELLELIDLLFES